MDQLVTRDVEAVGGVRDPDRLRRYLEALTLRSAGVVDDVTLIDAAGIAKETAHRYERLVQNLLPTVRILVGKDWWCRWWEKTEEE